MPNPILDSTSRRIVVFETQSASGKQTKRENINLARSRICHGEIGMRDSEIELGGSGRENLHCNYGLFVDKV